MEVSESKKVIALKFETSDVLLYFVYLPNWWWKLSVITKYLFLLESTFEKLSDTLAKFPFFGKFAAAEALDF